MRLIGKACRNTSSCKITKQGKIRRYDKLTSKTKGREIMRLIDEACLNRFSRKTTTKNTEKQGNTRQFDTRNHSYLGVRFIHLCPGGGLSRIRTSEIKISSSVPGTSSGGGDSLGVSQKVTLFFNIVSWLLQRKKQ